jgi:hypothetical protein
MCFVMTAGDRAPMNVHAAKLNALIDDFVAGRSNYDEFWSAFMSYWTDEIPDDGLTPSQWAAYEDVYELVHMGADDPVAPQDQAAGLIGASELRRRLQGLRARL